jgi:3-hydroxyacyl-CoA dehydrogenase
LIPSVSDDIHDVDNAMKWGFMHELGPFERWDALGVAESVARMKEEGETVADWVMEMLEAGVATREDIDTGINLGLNHPMGPLALADLVGLDTLFYIANSIYDEFKDPQFAPPTLLKKMLAAGWLGRKTGKGFYDYK